jgi:hypothetical protein
MRKWITISISSVLAVVAALWLLFFGIGIRFGGGITTDVLKDVLRKADIDTTKAGAISYRDLYGTRPEMSSLAIDPAPNRQDIVADLKRACASIGLSEPAQKVLKAEPNMICEGIYKHKQIVSVYVDLICAQRCRLFIRTVSM